MTDIETFRPANQNEWRKWLELNHDKKEAVWVIFHKKSSPSHNMSWSESVDEALCFGWIDSVKKSIDSEKFKQYFSKRKAKSNWSKINKDKVLTLIDQGLMQEAGFKSIEIAKENGSWTILDEIEALVVPQDLEDELEKHDGAAQYFKGLSKSVKKGLLYWVVSAKRKETRQKRVLEIADNAMLNMKPKQFR
ncbi:YdeI/OmpD-associated family protein [Carboxylicivirga sp. N1Y90]|uniref:YdeI/OmpD-associated family protein n=1 Tax=Carboxylicivirga fragile TaxID=3417571 RepID=UPI003D32D912|nr:YdeI/OmpD-associated family protein [Marinilabiliaceae bacterium N1Y90]